MSDSLWPHGLQNIRPHCASISPKVALIHVHWVNDALIISSSASPFSLHLQSFPSSRSFPVNWLFASGGQSIGVLASTSVFPVNIDSWFLLWLTGLSSLQSKGFSRVFSNATVQKHQAFSLIYSLLHHTWLLEKP